MTNITQRASKIHQFNDGIFLQNSFNLVEQFLDFFRKYFINKLKNIEISKLRIIWYWRKALEVGRADCFCSPLYLRQAGQPTVLENFPLKNFRAFSPEKILVNLKLNCCQRQ
jgi:hypothetical protein